MTAEVQGLLLGFNYAFILKYQIRITTEKLSKALMHGQMKTVFEIVARGVQIKERRRQLFIFDLSQSDYLEDLNSIAWTPVSSNTGYVLTIPYRNIPAVQHHSVQLIHTHTPSMCHVKITNTKGRTYNEQRMRILHHPTTQIQ